MLSSSGRWATARRGRYADSTSPIGLLPTYRGSYSQLGFRYLGAAGAAGVDSQERQLADDAAMLSEFLKRNEIDVPTILHDAVEKKLRAGPIAALLRDDGPFAMKIVIDNYGLGKGWGAGDYMRPSGQLRLVIVDADGRKVWQGEGAVSGTTTALPARKMEAWAADPAGLRAAFETAADMMADKALRGIR